MSQVALILFIVVVLPLIVIMHYTTKWKATKGLTSEDEKMLENVWQSSQRMESRINTLEAILDDQVPDWRRKT